MDQHPIPQDVTGFQFKLIGTMTVKQFGYVASGVVLAVILYYLPLAGPFAIFIKLLFVPIFASSGVILAFVPIDGRPIDLMATNFVKALFSPNQYIYHRQGRKLSFSTITITQAPQVQTAAQNIQHTEHAKQADEKSEKLRNFLLSSHDMVKNDLDKKEAAFLTQIGTPSAAATSASDAKKVSPPPLLKSTPASMPAVPAPAVAPIATAPKQATNEMLTDKEKQLEKELEEAKKEEITSVAPAAHEAAHQKVEGLDRQIQQIHAQKQKLEIELATLQKQLTQQKTPPAKPAPIPVQDPQHVRTIPEGITKKAGLPHVSDTPNVVVGIVKDPRGNVLSNILVEVKDKNGNPVRAFKTNALGQFASATPLSVGTYTLELEDPKKQHRFDMIQITTNNQIMPPIEVISHDAREDLRQQLFNQ